MHPSINDLVIHQIAVGDKQDFVLHVGQELKSSNGYIIGEVHSIHRLVDCLLEYGKSVFIIYIKNRKGEIKLWKSIEDLPISVTYNQKT